MHTIISNIQSSVTKFKRYCKKTLAHIQGKSKSSKSLQHASHYSLQKRHQPETNHLHHTIHNNENLIKTKNNHHSRKCVPCNATRCLCCRQLISTITFKSNQTNKTFKICHRVNCKSSFVIYLLECHICNIQYVGKSETQFNITLNNHRKNVKNPNVIPACKHFNRYDHDFTITEKSLSQSN